MCSIIGYKGRNSAAPIVVDGLQRMEYRGYDSVGIATLDGGKIVVRKGVGKVADVNKQLDMKNLPGRLGIGHTRWATHGSVTDKNAHPHSACSNDIAVVHNGIIENFSELKNELIGSGHTFASQTDSEVIAHLLEVHYFKSKSVKQAMMETCKTLKGSFGFVAIFGNGVIAGARFEEPLIIGVTSDGYFISSDVLGFLGSTDKAIFLENGDIAIIDEKKLEIFKFDGKPVAHPITQVAWELGAVDKGKYAHYTLKEINEQDKTVLSGFDDHEEAKVRNFCEILSGARTLFLTGSGTSYHAALIAKQVLSQVCRIQCETVLSSEFQYAMDAIGKDSVVLALSQSGETADVLHSIRLAKKKGAKTLSIVNVSTSSLAMESDAFLGINCGPEIGVAATKSFTGQVAVIYGVADRLSKGAFPKEARQELVAAIQKALHDSDALATAAERIKNASDIYLLGRSLHYPVALEGALKLKELAYVHAEGIAAGELKHGPLALMDKNTIVVMINPHDKTYTDTLSNAHEIKARSAMVIGISDENSDVYDLWIKIPKLEQEFFYPIVEVLPLQFLAYYLALENNANPDYPRNLAKSVTVR